RTHGPWTTSPRGAMREDAAREHAAPAHHHVAGDAMEIDRVREVVGELDHLGAPIDRRPGDVLVAGGDAPVLDLALLLERLHRLDRLFAVDRLGRRAVEQIDLKGVSA